MFFGVNPLPTPASISTFPVTRHFAQGPRSAFAFSPPKAAPPAHTDRQRKDGWVGASTGTSRRMTNTAGYMSWVPKQVDVNSLWDVGVCLQAPTTRTA